MKRVAVLLSLLSLALDLGIAFGQDSLVLGNRIVPGFSVSLSKKNLGLTYSYTLTNGPGAEQEIFRFWLLPPSRLSIDSLRAPAKWYIGIHDEDFLIINCVASDKNIKPGSSLSGFSFRSVSIPGIISFYAEGEHPLPRFQPGMATDSIRGYSNLTPYGPGIVGKTVGPVLPPDPFIAASFLDTLASYKHQAFALGWITNKGILNSLDQKLDNVRKQLGRDNTNTAKNILNAFIKEVEAQKDKHLTSEAYALLKYNAEYLIEKLEEQITKKK